MVSKKIRRLIEVVNALYFNIISEEAFEEWYFTFLNPYWMGRGALYEIYRKQNNCIGWCE